jgi:hypothetical protein
MIEIEKAGIPTVTLVGTDFQADADDSAEAYGMASLPRVVFPAATLTNYSPEKIREIVHGLGDEILAGLIEPVAVEPETDGHHGASSQIETFSDGTDYYANWETFNQRFLDRGWGDGFPLLPPTPQAVAAMLGGTRRAPSEVVAILEPGLGVATVEKLAINSVMAGCLPEHLPVVLAAIEAMSDRRYWLKNVATSTGPHAPMLVLNGPIVKRLGVNSGRAALGPGKQSRVNTVIGRAIRLIMMNVGFTYPASLDLDTIGSPNKYSMCLAENEDESPWVPYHVERGYRPTQSTVTVFSVESQMEIYDMKNHTPEGICTTYIGTVDSIGSAAVRQWMFPRRHADNAILLAPSHVKIFAEHGWSKTDIKRYIYMNAKRPAWMFKIVAENERIIPSMRWILDAPGDTMLPITGAYDWFHVIVVGGSGPKSSYTTGLGQAVTRIIEEPDGG